MKLSMIFGLTLAVMLAAAPARAASRVNPCAAARCAIQATLNSACPCHGTGNGSYYRCVLQKVKQLTAQGKVPGKCVRDILRCASGSTCGRRGFVICNIPKAGCRALNSTSSCQFAGGTVDPTATTCCTSCSTFPF
ncbi:MAG TPA: hypothetical protein VL403_00925 [Candidatus Kryptonia bacterium]|nr:hypothetical protein [Candidatus Kryptonia bacterium]